jgi:hypothetical protein
MKLFTRPYGSFLLIFLMMFSCRKAYNPPAIEGDNHFLAVNGFIYTGTAVTSTISLSRSLNLNDTLPDRPELNAQVVIESSAGNSYILIDSAGVGVYISQALTLDTTNQFRLTITTSDGNKYQSDFVSAKLAPPIDSLGWELANDPVTGQQDANIFVNAHDPTNATRYYRWDYLQTYKHVSTYSTSWADSNDVIYALPVGFSTHSCWSTVPSQNISLGTSIALSQDVISHVQVASFLQNDPTFDIGSSFLIRQYPLTEQGYAYWLSVQKNSQTLGGLFDLQPSQIQGNLHCLTNPDNPVIGFVSASTVQESRIYISNKSLPGWQSPHIDTATSCQIAIIPTDPLNELIWNYPDTSYGPYYFPSGGLFIAPKRCMDCRYQGGTLDKPSFWPMYD